MNLHTRDTGRLDDYAYDERAERERHRSLVLIGNWRRLAATQKSLARDYLHWSLQGGSQVSYYAQEAKRLEEESRKYTARAAKEQEELNHG